MDACGCCVACVTVWMGIDVCGCFVRCVTTWIGVDVCGCFVAFVTTWVGIDICGCFVACIRLWMGIGSPIGHPFPNRSLVPQSITRSAIGHPFPNRSPVKRVRSVTEKRDWEGWLRADKGVGEGCWWWPDRDANSVRTRVPLKWYD